MMNMNRLGPTMELRWKFYKTKKEANEGKDGEDEVGWGRHCMQTTGNRCYSTGKVLEKRRSIFFEFFIMMIRMTVNLNKFVSYWLM